MPLARWLMFILCWLPFVLIGPWFSEAAPANAAAMPAEEGWGTIKGQVIFSGDKIPESLPFNMTKDQDHCQSKGPQLDVKWKVHPKNKGLANVVVFLQPERGKALPVHESLGAPAQKEAVLDQPFCVFEPRVLAMRKDQTLLVKNPAPIPHNVVIDGFSNSYNVQMPPQSEKTFQLEASYLPNSLRCGAHEWMKGYLYVFEHPYFAVTDEEGKFAIKLAPAGTRTLVLWHEEAGWVVGRRGKNIDVKPGAETDLGRFEAKSD